MYKAQRGPLTQTMIGVPEQAESTANMCETTPNYITTEYGRVSPNRESYLPDTDWDRGPLTDIVSYQPMWGPTWYINTDENEMNRALGHFSAHTG